ncbi:MAG: hypothetical protein ACT4N9_05115 [Paracoccaceae bacterium]
MKKDLRWMKGIVAAAAACQTALPFQRGARRKPAPAKHAVPSRPTSARR